MRSKAEDLSTRHVSPAQLGRKFACTCSLTFSRLFLCELYYVFVSHSYLLSPVSPFPSKRAAKCDVAVLVILTYLYVNSAERSEAIL